MNKINPQDDYYYLEPAFHDSTILLPDGVIGETRLKIIRVGPGRMCESGEITKMLFKEGDIVMPPPRGLIEVGRGFILSQRDICITITDDSDVDELKKPAPSMIQSISETDAQLVIAEGRA